MTKFEEELHKNGGECFEMIKNGKTFYEIQGLTSSPLKIFRDWQPPQALPVVPECVAEYIKQSKGFLSFYGALFGIFNETDTELHEWVKGKRKLEVFARAWLDGYTVEKPQLFYIELPNVYGLKNKIFVSKVENGIIVEFSNGKNSALKLTEQEIRAIDEHYWLLAVPVEDGE